MERLRRRADFLRVRGGDRVARPAFVVEARARAPAADSVGPDGPARVGLTVTKKLGGAVVRNRIKRRLRAALALCGPSGLAPGTDYVIVARPPALRAPHGAIVAALAAALVRIGAGDPVRTAGAGRRTRRTDARKDGDVS